MQHWLKELIVSMFTFLTFALGALLIFACWSSMVLAAGYIEGVCFPDRPARLCREQYFDYVLSFNWIGWSFLLLVILIFTIFLAMMFAGRGK